MNPTPRRELSIWAGTVTIPAQPWKKMIGPERNGPKRLFPVYLTK